MLLQVAARPDIHANLPLAIHTSAGTQIQRHLLYRTETLSAAHAPDSKSGPRSVAGARGRVFSGQWTLQSSSKHVDHVDGFPLR
jgi:hypothetical protein